MRTTEPLSEREQQALQLMREAQEQGSTLKAYAAKIGRDVGHACQLSVDLNLAAGTVYFTACHAARTPPKSSRGIGPLTSSSQI